MTPDQFLRPKGNYRNLIVYKKAECLYDITFHFVKTYLSYSDRTNDQMIQAARSGKQNIIEGSSASVTSRETEIKLFNVAKSSFEELLADYEDYLRVRGKKLWDEEKTQKVRQFCRTHNDSALYRKIAPQRDDSTLANLCITMIHQEITLLIKLMSRAKRDFLQNGGIREEMSRARRSYRANQVPPTPPPPPIIPTFPKTPINPTPPAPSTTPNEEKIYRSKIDWWVWCTVAFALTVTIVAGIGSAWWVTAVLAGSMAAMLAVLILGCWYEINGDTLVVYRFFMPHRLPIKKIKEVRKTTGYLATAGMSSRRVSIKFADRSVLRSSMPLEISPADRDGFITHLHQINPSIQLGK